jgi:hypothetical protein
MRTLNGYTTLNGLLNPETQLSDQVRVLVESYADKEDWVHLVIALNGGELSDSTDPGN